MLALLSSFLLITTLHAQDLKSIFQTPNKRNYDDFEILERANFATDSTGTAPSTLKDTPRSYANAQVLVRFGGEQEPGKCGCGEGCQCKSNPCYIPIPLPYCVCAPPNHQYYASPTERGVKLLPFCPPPLLPYMAVPDVPPTYASNQQHAPRVEGGVKLLRYLAPSDARPTYGPTQYCAPPEVIPDAHPTYAPSLEGGVKLLPCLAPPDARPTYGPTQYCAPPEVIPDDPPTYGPPLEGEVKLLPCLAPPDARPTYGPTQYCAPPEVIPDDPATYVPPLEGGVKVLPCSGPPEAISDAPPNYYPNSYYAPLVMSEVKPPLPEEIENEGVEEDPDKMKCLKQVSEKLEPHELSPNVKFVTLDLGKVPKPSKKDICALDKSLVIYSSPKQKVPKKLITYPIFNKAEFYRSGCKLSEGGGYYSDPVKTIVYKKPTILSIVRPQSRVIYVPVGHNVPKSHTEDCSCASCAKYTGELNEL